MKETLRGLLIIMIIAVPLYYFGCSKKKSSEESKNMEEFQPIDEFKSAYDILSKNQRTENEYDIEETVRIMNALEIAQSQSDDFYAFLEYMAKQDYSQVASEVIDAKKRLLSILQQMFQLRAQHEEMSEVWTVVKTMAQQNAQTVVQNIDIATVHRATAKDPVAIAQTMIAVNRMGQEVMDNYKKQIDAKKNVKEQLDQLKMDYLDYLSHFSPIYHKYMKEWDRICIEKDKIYLDVYAGRMEDAYNRATQLLEKYPTNKEAMLMKSLATIGLIPTNLKTQIEMPPIEIGVSTIDNDSITLPLDEVSSIEENPIATSSPVQNSYYHIAEDLLSNYLNLYPERSAPALLLKGLLNYQVGNYDSALSFFDQSAIEYPRQAEYLLDMLDSYNNRAYLNKSQEGQYLLKLYRSTMEGYGIFSPNFMKARYYAETGQMNESKNEIYKHFFRRGNQGIYHCLLSDMQYCEEFLYSSFKQLLMEQSFIDIEIKPTKDWKLSSKKDELEVSLNNRSDLDLENVRVFLCLHYTDMYTDEYDVIKVPMTKNRIDHHTNISLGEVKLDYCDKRYDDITRVRAICMTDDKICWIDNVDYKVINATSSLNLKQYGQDVLLSEIHSNYLNNFSLTPELLMGIIDNKISINGYKNEVASANNNTKSDVDEKWYSFSNVKKVASSVTELWDNTNKGLKIELPRILTLIDPVFSLYPIKDSKMVQSKTSFLSGEHIKLEFDYTLKEDEVIPLYVYSKFISFKINIKRSNNIPIVDGIELI